MTRQFSAAINPPITPCELPQLERGSRAGLENRKPPQTAATAARGEGQDPAEVQTANNRLHPRARNHGVLVPDAGIEPTFTTYMGADPVAFVTSENASRRHLTESQLAYAVSAMAPFEERKARERQIALAGTRKGDLGAGRPQGEDVGRTTEKLAEKAGVGARTVRRALKVRKHGKSALRRQCQIPENDRTRVVSARIRCLYGRRYGYQPPTHNGTAPDGLASIADRGEA